MNSKIGEVEKKVPDASGLVTTTLLNAKLGEVQNKIPGHAKYITAFKFNKLAGLIFDTKLKHVNLPTNIYIDPVSQWVIFLLKFFLVTKVFKICYYFQPIVRAIDFKQEKNKNKVSAWNSKGVYIIKYFNREI